MTAEQQFFIQILADHVHGRPSVPETDSLNWKSSITMPRSRPSPAWCMSRQRIFLRIIRILPLISERSCIKVFIRMCICMPTAEQNSRPLPAMQRGSYGTDERDRPPGVLSGSGSALYGRYRCCHPYRRSGRRRTGSCWKTVTARW